VSLSAILGLVALNALFLAAGTALVWALRGFSRVSDAAGLAGLSYLLGLAVCSVLLVVELVVGVPFGAGLVAANCAAVAVGAVLVGRLRAPPRSREEPGHGAVGPVLLTGVGAALAIVFLEAMFRAGRLAGLFEWDAMAFWVPKAKVIYFLGGLDERLFLEVPGQSYPPLVPAFQASAFAFMGDADTVTVHLLFWFPLAAFVAAVAGLLAPRVPALLLWPLLLLGVLTPEVVDRALAPQADLLLDYFVALAALLVALWLVERQTYQLVMSAALLSAAMLTKREGYLLAACIGAAALIASWRDWRWAWPRLAVALGAAFVPTLSWRIWFTSRDVTGEGPEAGGLGLFDHLDRAWPSLRLALSALFDADLWLVVAPLGVLAVVLAFVAGARRLPAYAALLTFFMVAGFTWMTWSFPSLPITKNGAVNPIVRLTGALILTFAALVPLLLAAAWRGEREGRA
jgi:hypothetical protein